MWKLRLPHRIEPLQKDQDACSAKSKQRCLNRCGYQNAQIWVNDDKAHILTIAGSNLTKLVRQAEIYGNTDSAATHSLGDESLLRRAWLWTSFSQQTPTAHVCGCLPFRGPAAALMIPTLPLLTRLETSHCWLGDGWASAGPSSGCRWRSSSAFAGQTG